MTIKAIRWYQDPNTGTERLEMLTGTRWAPVPVYRESVTPDPAEDSNPFVGVSRVTVQNSVATEDYVTPNPATSDPDTDE